MTNVERLAELERCVGERFGNPVLLLAALTHRSFTHEAREGVDQDNERLEFLGDAVIDLVISHRLMERRPDSREGELSKLRAALVNEEGLSRIARSLGLGDLLLLGRGEEATGGRQRASVLANALEAVIGALYLDAGLATVLRFVDRAFGQAIEEAVTGSLAPDYKTLVQELAQARFKMPPRYRVVTQTGPDHERVFSIELTVNGIPFGEGTGRSKKEAEQAAARIAHPKLLAQ